jgi:hypothetical protein
VEARYVSGRRACQLRSAVCCSRLASTAAAVTNDRDDTATPHYAAVRLCHALQSAGKAPTAGNIPREMLSLRTTPGPVDIFGGYPLLNDLHLAYTYPRLIRICFAQHIFLCLSVCAVNCSHLSLAHSRLGVSDRQTH